MFVYKNHNSNGVLLVTKEYQQILKILGRKEEYY